MQVTRVRICRKQVKALGVQNLSRLSKPDLHRSHNRNLGEEACWSLVVESWTPIVGAVDTRHFLKSLGCWLPGASHEIVTIRIKTWVSRIASEFQTASVCPELVQNSASGTPVDVSKSLWVSRIRYGCPESQNLKF